MTSEISLYNNAKQRDSQSTKKSRFIQEDFSSGSPEQAKQTRLAQRKEIDILHFQG